MKFKIGLPEKRSTRIWLALVILTIAIVGAGVLFYFTSRGMFHTNPRFVLRELKINSGGYWGGREKHLAYLLHLNPGTTNMFSVSLPQLRAELLKREPSIEKVSIRRILPDMMIFEITERIPRAFIGAPNSKLLIDSEGVVIAADKCIKLNSNLPVFHGIPNIQKLKPGEKPSGTAPALELIMLTVTEPKYTDLRLGLVSIDFRKALVCGLYYKGRVSGDDAFRVYMPDSDLRKSLDKLIPALDEIRRSGSGKKEIDLRYSNRAIVRDLGGRTPSTR